MNILYTAEAVVEGGRAGHGRTSDGRLDVTLSVPKEMSGDGGPGTNPEQLFAVGYAACFQSTLLSLARDVWPLIRAPGVDTLVRYGTALETIQREAAEWRADVVVVATHGKGPVKRMLVGSVTEGLINHLPTSLLVVPAGAGGAALVEPDAAELITVKHEEET